MHQVMIFTVAALMQLGVTESMWTAEIQTYTPGSSNIAGWKMGAPD